jgi:hypothetical protein
MSDIASTPTAAPADPFAAPTAAPAVTPEPAPTATPATPAPAPAVNPFEPAPAPVVEEAPATPTGPTVAAGSIVAYSHDDPYSGKTEVKAGIVVSAVEATDDQGPQVVVAWLGDTSILPTTDVYVVDTSGS